jgi:hypothetical protein
MKQELHLKIAEVKPWWLRLIILAIIGLPIVSGYPLPIFSTPENSIHNILLWLGYGCFIWLFILLNVGAKQLLKYLSFAFTLAIITSFLGVIVRRIIAIVFEESAADAEYISFKMLSLLIVMISVIPYTLFFINCFSVSSFVARLSFDGDKNYKLKVHLALALRVFQHVGEVISNLLLVWKEENPLMIKPRFRADLQENKLSIIGWFNWFKNSVVTWCFALLMHTLEAIPYLSEEMKAVMVNNKTYKINQHEK